MNYPHKCKICQFPSRHTICSNYKCKSWKILRKQASLIKTHGLTDDDPIILYCPKCMTDTALGGAGRGRMERNNIIYCAMCKKYYPFTFIATLWYQSGNKTKTYITEYLGNDLWDYYGEIAQLRPLKSRYY